jgi:hypothetical protein
MDTKLVKVYTAPTMDVVTEEVWKTKKDMEKEI